ncbi:hypothetical protein [Aquimarina sp. I32.4]|uniref:hypothetical protein n=1 Tax=Aquimarina sp. I32.4 TaxID=2053903 RepID=UPI000CDF0380|nr:hypothetical protein [Aquimarina sp. I32.4]
MKIDLEAQGFPTFKLPANQDLILLLIKNELISTQFAHQLDTIGFDTSSYSIELGSAILSLVGFTDRTDTLWEWYYNMLDSYIEKINLEENGITERVIFDFYIALRIKLHTESIKVA